MQKFLSLVVILTLSLITTQAFGQHAGHKHEAGSVEITKPELLTQNLSGDVVYGKEDAPVTIVEYASLSCSHCGAFYNDIVKDLKTKYIETGKVRLIYRHFPLNLPALQAALLVDCTVGQAERRKLIDTLFSHQSGWAYTPDFSDKLRKIARIAGIDVKTFNDCISDTAREEAILKHQLEAQQGLAVRSTPAIFINGKPHNGGRNFDELSKYIDGLL